MRLDLNLLFDRVYSKLLFLVFDVSYIVMCIDYGFIRVVENLVMKVVRICFDFELRLVYYLFSFLMLY